MKRNSSQGKAVWHIYDKLFFVCCVLFVVFFLSSVLGIYDFREKEITLLTIQYIGLYCLLKPILLYISLKKKKKGYNK